MKLKNKQKQLIKRALMNAKSQGHNVLTSSEIAERYNADPNLPHNMQRSARQLTFDLKKLAREEGNGIETVVLSKNGINHHGNPRVKLGYSINLNQAVDDPDVIEPKPVRKTISVIVGDSEIAYLDQMKKQFGESPGAVFRRLIEEAQN